MFDDLQHPPIVPLSTVFSYDVEDIEPQEDGKPLYVIAIVVNRLVFNHMSTDAILLRCEPLQFRSSLFQTRTPRRGALRI